jgi:class 3 adenylate cyclase
MQAARQDTERNADTPAVAHARTITTLRTDVSASNETGADLLPGHFPDALDGIHRHSDTH